MSLTKEQENITQKELEANLAKSGLSIHEIAADLGTTDDYIDQLMHLKPLRIEDTWILRNYLLEKVKESGQEPTPFTILRVNPRRIWFLNADYIEGGKITTR